MKVVKVYGELKERLGGRDTFKFNVFTPAEAIKALMSNFAGLDKWFINSEQDGIRYKVLLGDHALSEDNLEEFFYPWSEKDVFHIIPIFSGSGFWDDAFNFIKGVGGVVLAGVGIVTGNSWMVQLGVGLAIHGVVNLLTPDPPKPPAPDQLLESFSFSGIEQTTKQGGAVPVCYGKCFIGSSVLSAGIETFDG